MKKFLFLSALLLALAGQARAQTAPAGIVVVRVYEGGSDVTAIITRGEGKSEKVTFANGVTDKNLTRASEGYYKLFERFYQEGYSLQSTFNSVYSANIGYTTLLFVKHN
ncbi:MAG: hypothetical protein EOO59_01930 [Hymenobacter sp.]|nr:MAG: hypothetical protein EOO59_01930 [Hymenobacter sp.]